MTAKAANDADLVSVIEVAERFGVFKQTVFKVLTRLGIRWVKRRDAGRRNQLVAFITEAELKRVAEELSKADSEPETNNRAWSAGDDLGFFYLIQLEPEHDPGRFKVGFTVSVSERLRTHRCAAPFATIVRTWPCKRTWERAAIDCVAAGCEQLHTEVFRVDRIDDVADHADQFFRLMPTIDDTAELGEAEDAGSDSV